MPTTLEIKTDTLWVELDETTPEDWNEFKTLFSRQVTEKKTVVKKQSKAKEVAKLLDQKRSQNVGILISSLRLDISEVENAVYNFDTSVVDLEALQKIYEVRPNVEELQLIKSHLEKTDAMTLDKPEQFLYDLAQIPEYADRVTCIMFQATFVENISGIENKLNNLKMICEFLMTRESVKQILGIILALGNYMNAGNRSRGQADGFGLEILGKLKDVKSKDNSLTLLHYIVQTYIRKFQSDEKLESALFPLVEPGDVDKATLFNFDDVTNDLKKLRSQVTSCEAKVAKVLELSDEEHKQPFQEKMEEFLKKANTEHKEQEDHLEETRQKFLEMKLFYSWNPKIQNQSEWPKEFFTPWVPFCNDFKNLWKKELQRKIKEDIELAKKRVQEMKKEKRANIKVAGKPTGLKAKLAKKGMIHRDNSSSKE